MRAEPHPGAVGQRQAVGVVLPLHRDLKARPPHGQVGELGGHGRAERRCGLLPSVAQAQRGVDEDALLPHRLLAHLGGSLVRTLKLIEPSRRAAAPREDVVDRRPIAPGQSAECGPALLHHRQPSGIGVDAVQVGGQVGAEIGRQVGDFGRPPTQGRELRIVALLGGQGSACVGQEARSPSPCAGARVVDTHQRVVGAAGRGAERVGMGQPLVLGAQVLIFAGARVEPLELVQAAAEHVDLDRAVAGQLGESPQFRLEGGEGPVGVLVGVRHLGEGCATVIVQNHPMLVGTTQPPLVGLPVHGDQELAEFPEDGDGSLAPPDVRFAAPLVGDGAGEDQVVGELRARRGGAVPGHVVGRDLNLALDDRLGPAVAHHAGVPARSEQQPEA